MAKTKTKGATAHPIANVRWVDPDTLHANDYNPNHVFGPELKLLKLSILEDGWTQPVVIREGGQIVDGFHRWTLARTDAAVRKASGGKVPVVVLPARSEADLVASTVRHNRARGQHGVLKMGDIVRSLRDEHGQSDADIKRKLGMDREELTRLADQRGAPELMGKDSFGKGWVPVPGPNK